MNNTAVEKKVPLLGMRNISKSFPGVLALNDVNFSLDYGEVHALVGENGAGKSTLMKILSGAYHSDSGEILIAGKVVKIKSPRQAQDYGISTIYQELNLIPQLSVASNIFLGREPSGPVGYLDKNKIYQETSRILAELHLKMDLQSPIRSLSVAEQQMVEVAKALLYQTKILIMDEPTSALTAQEIETLFKTIRKIKESGVGIIYISHHLEEIFQICDRVTVLRDGQQVGSYSLSDIDKRKLIRLMANRDLKEYYPRLRGEPGEEILRVSGLERRKDLKNINFILRRGEILGIAGLLGSGRTELARAIFGIDRIDQGEMLFKDRVVTINSPRQAIRTGIGFLTEDRKQLGLVLRLSIKDNIGLPNLDHFSRWGILKKKEQFQISTKLINDLRIKATNCLQKVVYLSGGNQQKVVLSKWLARQLDLLIFDEPTRGIDVAAKVEIYQLMNQLTARGVGIIMISSELPEILGMSDRIIVMHDGTITAEFTAGEATQEKILAKALGEVA
jgi:ribose transport system ATP-binding protein